MRSDREEIPEGFTKEQADETEMMEARTQKQARTSRAAPGCQEYWPAPFQVCGAIRDKYNSLGAQFSFLLLPTSNELTSPDGHGKFTTFMNGPIYWSAAGGAHPVVNSFLNRWGVHGYETGWMGYPTTDEIVHADGIGRRQEFQHGAIYVSVPNAIGSSIGGAIRDKWNTVGAETPGSLLGYPMSDETPLVGNGRMNRFERGFIYWSPTTGAWPVTGSVLEKWAQSGSEAGQFGYPVGDQYSLDGDVTVKQNFQHGTVTAPGPKPIELSILNPGSAPQQIIDEAIRLADEVARSVADVIADGLIEARDAKFKSDGIGNSAPGQEIALPTPRGPGDIFYSRATTATANHGHNGIFVTMSHTVEAGDQSGVAMHDTVVAGGRKMLSPEMFWVNTSAGVRQNAVDFALSKVGLDYNYQFWSNKVVNAVAYNCSQLIWAAYYEASGMSVDLDSNKGTGVYPLDIRASSKVTPYP